MFKSRVRPSVTAPVGPSDRPGLTRRIGRIADWEGEQDRPGSPGLLVMASSSQAFGLMA